MINNIRIKNFTIIEQLVLDFAAGMTALTGETGAGKSIIIDAIELAMGARVTSQVVRHGCDRADIAISFDVTNNITVKNCLKALELDSNDECIIRRTISKDGRSKSFINDVPTTLQSLRKVAENLINIHGQHEFQSLLKSELQRKLLDDFADNTELLKRLKMIYQEWKHTKSEYDDLKLSTKDITAREEFLLYQVRELDELNLVAGEIEQLNQEHRQLANADSLLSNCQQVLIALSEGEEASAVLLLHQAARALEVVKEMDHKLANAAELLSGVMLDVEEASTEVRHYLDTIDLNPARLSLIEQRLAKIYNIARKHHVSAEDLIEIHEQMQEELSKLENKDELLLNLEKKIKEIEKDYFVIAEKLSQRRQKYAKKLCKSIVEKMQQLGMMGGKFDIELKKQQVIQPSPYGNELVAFLVTANCGQPLQDLTKVASGGELSRISLAIQVIAAKKSNTPVLIFDEVDVGIGGATAEVVGKLLKELGQSTQILCITHLAQVAANSQSHLRVTKDSNNQSTIVNVSYLDEKEKVNELARMIGGLKITKQSLAHAKEMLLLSSH